MPELDDGVGLLDTSVLLDLEVSSRLPRETCIAAVGLAELAVGPHATRDPIERSRRQHHLQIVEATYDPLPFDVGCARAYGRVFAAATAAGRKPRGRRAVDLMIAATAVAHELPLYTRNPRDLDGLGALVRVIDAR